MESVTRVQTDSSSESHRGSNTALGLSDELIRRINRGENIAVDATSLDQHIRPWHRIAEIERPEGVRRRKAAG